MITHSDIEDDLCYWSNKVGQPDILETESESEVKHRKNKQHDYDDDHTHINSYCHTQWHWRWLWRWRWCKKCHLERLVKVWKALINDPFIGNALLSVFSFIFCILLPHPIHTQFVWTLIDCKIKGNWRELWPWTFQTSSLMPFLIEPIRKSGRGNCWECEKCKKTFTSKTKKCIFFSFFKLCLLFDWRCLLPLCFYVS